MSANTFSGPAAGLEDLEGEPTCAMVTEPAPEMPTSMVERRAPPTAQETALFEQAALLGYVCQPLSGLKAELATTIARRLVNRTGTDVYQAAAFVLANVPRAAAEQLLPPQHLKEGTPPGTTTWSIESVDDVRTALGPLLACESSSACTGITRALMKPSERCVRVVATLMPPVEISHVETAGGRNLLYVNLMCAARPAPHACLHASLRT